MSTVALGRNARVKKNGTTIAKVTSGTFNGTEGTIDITSLGDQWDKFAAGMSAYTMGLELLMVIDDTEQNLIQAAFMNRTELPDIEIWLDATTYIYCDTITDSEATMIVSSYTINFDNGSAVSVSATLQGSGPVAKGNGGP